MIKTLKVRLRHGSTALIAMAIAASSAAPALSQEQNNRVPDRQKYVTLQGIQSATVAPPGLVFGAGSSSAELGGSSASEGIVGTLGFGFGSAERGIGGQATLSVFGANGGNSAYHYWGLKAAHRLKTAEPTYVALAVDRLAPTGPVSNEDPAATLVVTRFSNYSNGAGGESYPVMMSLGVGTHVRNQASDPGVYFGAGIGLTQGIGASVAWNGDDIDLGAAFRFEQLDNAGFSVVLTDALNQNNRRGISFGIGLFFDTGLGR